MSLEHVLQFQNHSDLLLHIPSMIISFYFTHETIVDTRH